MKIAIVEVCGTHWFRCPECQSLNINNETVPEEDSAQCPDCGAEFTLPEIMHCECPQGKIESG